MKTMIVKSNGSEVEIGDFPADMSADDILTLAKASAAKQDDSSVALGVLDKEETGEDGEARKIFLKQDRAKTKG